MSFSGGPGDMLNLGGTLTENTGRFAVNGSGYVANVGALSINPTILQQSYIFVGPGATLNLTNQPSGIPDVVFHRTYEIGGTFSNGGDNPFQNLHSIEGHLDIFNGQTTNIVPSGGALSIYCNYYYSPANLGVSGGSTVNIAGDVTNDGIISIVDSTVNVNGTLFNYGTFSNVGPESGLHVQAGGVANLEKLQQMLAPSG